MSVAIRDQEAALAEARTIGLAIAAEKARASAPDFDDRDVEAFGRWYAAARLRQEASLAAADRAEAAIAQARAQVTRTRAAAEAVDQRIAADAAEAEAEQARRDQNALDDIAIQRRSAGW